MGKERMEDREILFDHTDKSHTTEMGAAFLWILMGLFVVI